MRRGQKADAAQGVGHLAADGNDGDILLRDAGLAVLLQGFEDLPDDVGVEPAAEGGVGGDGDEGDAGRGNAGRGGG